ncbi:MAG: gluconokinase [Betaproteobacteria bacterium]|nr:MAG: gluconokinase [Betaproteobacteria bacterium]
MIVGVCGCGKTTIGRALAQELGWRFLDGDDFHPETNVTKMASGIPLTDDDRWPWFDRIVAEMRRVSAAGEHAVVACSALKQAYRDRLAAGGDVRVVYLKGDAATIEPRLARRAGHFMPASLLPSQFATLEEPTGAIVVDIREPIAVQVAAITRALREQLAT